MFERIIRLGIRNPVFVNLLFFLVCGAGIMGWMGLPSEQFPEVTLDRVSVDVFYPGATATDVEELVVRPIEEALEEVNDVKIVQSTAAEGSANVVVTFLSGKDLAEGRSEVEKAVSTVDDFPDDVDTPRIREMKLELPVIALSLLGDHDAVKTADEIAERLRDIPGVAMVNQTGGSERRIVVELDKERVRALGLQPALVAASIKAARTSVPAGTIERGGKEIFVKTDKRIRSAQDVRSIPLNLGSKLRVGDVARVRDIREDPDTRVYVSGKESIQLVITRERSADPIAIRETVIEQLPELGSVAGGRLELVLSEDYTVVIRDRLRTVFINGASGMLLVFLVLWLVSGLRQAVLAVWGMPVSYLTATFLMGQVGLTINVVSTFGLLIATGIIVDDAIVVIENTQRHLEMGKSRVEAAVDGAKEVLLPVTVAVLTTCFAFMPLTMVGGTIGRVMKIMPLVVIFCLLGSLIEAIFILPGHLSEYASTDAQGSRTERLGERMKSVYRPVVGWAIRHRWLTALLTLVMLGATGVAASSMKRQFGAPGKPTELNLTFELAPGLDRAQTRAKGEELIALVAAQVGDDVRSEKLRVGSTRNVQSGFVTSGANVGSVRWEFELTDALLSEYPSMLVKLETRLAQDPDFGAYTVQEVQAGPPAGAAVNARFRGRDPREIDGAVREMKNWLRDLKGVEDIADDSGTGKDTLGVVVDQDRASLYGLSEADIARAVRGAIEGVVADEISIDEERVEILVRYAGGQGLDRDSVDSLPIATPTGRVVMLSEVASPVRTREASFARRRDSKRTVSVTADVDTKLTTGAEAMEEIRAHWDTQMKPRYPGLELSFGGQAEEDQESLNDLKPAFMLAMALIYVVLALQFHSYVQPFIILLAVPFGVMGAIWGLFLLGYALSIFALFGVVALTGIVVNDSLVMVDFINKQRDEGSSVADAAREGAVARLRPILSTTLTTCFGLGPLAFGIGGTDEILAPMAISIAGGLGISTGLVLVVVPAAYVILMQDVLGLAQRLRGKGPAPAQDG